MWPLSSEKLNYIRGKRHKSACLKTEHYASIRSGDIGKVKKLLDVTQCRTALHTCANNDSLKGNT